MRSPRAIAARPGVDVVGVMFYEAQVAGLPDSSRAIRAVKRLSIADLATRRGAVVAAVQEAVGHPLSIVNSGGSGSVASSAADPAVTEVTAGSGLFVPTLFDDYRSFTPRPAAFFGLDVVRIPGAGFATAFGGGYIASGPATKSASAASGLARRAVADQPEGAGEVQTPLRLSGRSRPARRRPRLVPARQGRRGHGALRLGAPRARHRDRGHRPDVPRRVPELRLKVPRHTSPAVIASPAPGGVPRRYPCRVTLRLFDTATRTVRDFVPLVPGEVGVYLCGATVQSPPHIGPPAVRASRSTCWCGGCARRATKVTLIRNVTDIDDKILAKAADAGEPWWA